MGENDHAAIRAVLKGDKDAYKALVLRHSRSVFRVAFRITGNEADADDVVQDAFLRGYRKLEGFRAEANFGTWIYRIAVRCALDKVNSRRDAAYRIADDADPEAGEIQLADNSVSPERLVLSGEVGRMQQAALHSLTALERVAFIMRHMEDRSTAEIASALDIQPNAAKQAVYRAVQKLRQRLAPLYVKV
jgi:RNA polymerase sigma-70 factor (ECF subfamily)